MEEEEEEANRRHLPRPRMDATADPDRLSALPDYLLILIISSLPLADAIRTGALSTKWKNLWKHLDQITLNYPNLDWRHKYCSNIRMLVREQLFVNAVTDSLLQFECPNITKFSLVLKDCDFHVKSLDTWFQWAFSRNVKELKWVCDKSFYSGFNGLYGISSLEKLYIKGLQMTNFGSVFTTPYWTSLKSLTFSHVHIRHQDIANILMGCPVLENLCLRNVLSAERLHIVSPCVKNLQIVIDQQDIMLFCQITAPKLEYLDAAGCYHSKAIRLMDVSSLRKADLNLIYEFACLIDDKITADYFLRMCTPLLESVCHVEELGLGLGHFQALSLMKLLDRPCPLFKCKHLTIQIHASGYDIPGMAYLFQRSPCVETLLIKVECRGFGFNSQVKDGLYIKDIFKVDEVEYFCRQKVDFQSLKKLEILHNFYAYSLNQSGGNNEEHFDFGITAYIIRKALFLEKVIIAAQDMEEHPDRRVYSRNRVSEYFSQLRQKLFICLSKWFEDGEWEITVKESACEIVCWKRVAALGNL